MARFFPLTRRTLTPFSSFPPTVSMAYATFSYPFRKLVESDSSAAANSRNQLRRQIELPPLVPTSSAHLEGFSIELVEEDLWPRVLGEADTRALDPLDEMPDSNLVALDECPDIDKIEDLRARKKLFYKLDRDSKEFEEYNIDFHQRKSQKNGREKPVENNWKEERKKPDKLDYGSGIVKAEPVVAVKRARTLTFNQLTGPYHLPFCLDIYITKGSVRASIVHRVTSKVVAVAHSISKDLKFDVGSRKDVKACAAVGSVLAQRAIEDDIHNVVYTPRKGDKIEGKLEVVLRYIIDNGIDVKVKLKQRKHMKKTITRLVIITPSHVDQASTRAK